MPTTFTFEVRDCQPLGPHSRSITSSSHSGHARHPRAAGAATPGHAVSPVYPGARALALMLPGKCLFSGRCQRCHPLTSALLPRPSQVQVISGRRRGRGGCCRKEESFLAPGHCRLSPPSYWLPTNPASTQLPNKNGKYWISLHDRLSTPEFWIFRPPVSQTLIL